MKPLTPGPTYGSQTYRLKQAIVQVAWKQYSPAQLLNAQGKQIIIFFCGWGKSERAQSVQELAQTFADTAGAPTYVLTTKAKHAPKHQSLHAEAEAVKLWVEDRSCEEIIVTGHSEGGKKAVEVAARFGCLSTSKSLKGIVLLNAVGWYDQRAAKIAWNFFWDSLVLTPLTLLQQKRPRLLFRRYFRASGDITRGAVRKTPLQIGHDLHEMATASPVLDKVRAPVVLVQGVHDPVSSPRKTGDMRQMFPNSPWVKRVIAAKLGVHGLPLYRSRAVARCSLYLLARYDRQESDRLPLKEGRQQTPTRKEQVSIMSEVADTRSRL